MAVVVVAAIVYFTWAADSHIAGDLFSVPCCTHLKPIGKLGAEQSTNDYILSFVHPAVDSGNKKRLYTLRLDSSPLWVLRASNRRFQNGKYQS